MISVDIFVKKSHKKRRVVRPFLFANGLFDPVFTTEFIDTTAGIKHFLLTGVERMAGRTNINVQSGLTQCGAGRKGLPTATSDIDVCIFWMNVGTHENLAHKYLL